MTDPQSVEALLRRADSVNPPDRTVEEHRWAAQLILDLARELRAAREENAGRVKPETHAYAVRYAEQMARERDAIFDEMREKIAVYAPVVAAARAVTRNPTMTAVDKLRKFVRALDAQERKP